MARELDDAGSVEINFDTDIPTLPSLRPRTAVSPALPLPSRMPTATKPPPNLPVAAPFELREGRRPVEDTWVGRRRDANALARKLAIPALVCIGVGAGLGVYLSRARHPAPAPVTQSAAPQQAAPAAPPTETVLHPMATVAESANAATASAGGMQPEPPTREEQAAQMAAASSETTTPTAATMTHDAPAAARDTVAARTSGALVDVRIDSEPPGASITLVDGTSRFPLGTTPLATSLDPARQYDVVIEAAGRAAQTVHVDPAKTTHVAVTVAKTPRAEPAEPKAELAKADAPRVDTASTAPAALPVTRTMAKPSVAKVQPEAQTMAVDPSTPGTLMVSAKPPCELLIDGAATGLRTPQRSIDLAPGRHEITFVNAEQGIKKTVSVTIRPGAPTKLLQDLMK